MMDMISAPTMDSQIPSSSQMSGNSSTAASWNTSVRRKDISALVRPSLSAVKNDEPNIEKPENRNANENIPKACTVMARSLSS